MAPQPRLEVVALRTVEVEYGPAKAVPCSKKFSERSKSGNGAAHLQIPVDEFEQLERKDKRRRSRGSRTSVGI